MKQVRKYFYVADVLLSAILIFISCSDNKRISSEENSSLSSEPEFSITVSTERDSLVKSSSIFKKISYLALESSEDVLIGNIDKLLFDNGKIFIADKERAQAIFIFDERGRLTNKIDKKGKGPGEFSEIRDFTLDTKNHRICLLDQSGRKINFYTYSGEYIESKPMPFLFSSFVYIDSLTLAFDLRTAVNKENEEVNNYYLAISDINGNIYNTAFDYQEEERNFTYWSPIHLRCFGDQILFQPRFSSTIYTVTKEGVLPYFFLDFQGKGFSEEEKRVTSNERFLELSKSYSYFNGEFVDLENVACFAVNTPTGYYNVLYSKRKRKSVLLKPLLIEDFLSNFFHPPFERYSENTIVTFAYAYQILRSKKAHGPDQIFERGLFENLTENNNPILFFYELKDF